jgi:hypothetical protein
MARPACGAAFFTGAFAAVAFETPDLVWRRAAGRAVSLAARRARGGAAFLAVLAFGRDFLGRRLAAARARDEGDPVGRVRWAAAFFVPVLERLERLADLRLAMTESFLTLTVLR